MKMMLIAVLIVILVSACGSTMAACKEYNDAVAKGEAEGMEHPGYDLEHAAWITGSWLYLYWLINMAAE